MDSGSLRTANILVTGGAGTLGWAIAKRRKREGWTGRLSVYSTDNHKHDALRRVFPDITCIQGDVRNDITLMAAMAGHEIVIHAAAVKVIPDSELWSIDTIDVNVQGSLSVCNSARSAGIQHVIGISTDKACHPANAYGATKMLMEKVFQEYARIDGGPRYHLVRYGNVLVSNGSVIQIWQEAVRRGQKPRLTLPEMTRFWLSPDQAVTHIKSSLLVPTGHVFVPQLKSMSVGDMFACAMEFIGQPADHPYDIIPIRPGEKTHETLLTVEEGWLAWEGGVENEDGYDEGYVIRPTDHKRNKEALAPYSSDVSERLNPEQLRFMLKDV